MGLFDKDKLMSKMKDTAEKAKQAAATASDKAKEAVTNAKAAHDQKKAEQEQHRIEMEAKATAKAQEIIDAITSYENNGSFFDGLSRDELLGFTKEFYDKVLLPAHSVTASKLTMHPYIESKQIQKFASAFPGFNSGEAVLVHLRTEGKQEFVLTSEALYFALALDEDPKFFARGRIPCSQISVFSTERTDNAYLLKCDDYVLASFAVERTITEDFVSLNNYFQCIINHDFDITDEEVDRLIQEKIGEKVYAEVRKYLVYDDELMVYFAWGLDSLSAKDYIVCTNKQIIIMNREMFGATANVKQFYYEDITSASTVQNSNSSDLTSALLETALTAATKTCDLVITVAGSVTRINTLYKVEAERVVAVYHQYRKAAKTAASQPQVIVQQAAVKPMEQLEKLAKLKEMGVLSEEEFNQKKAELLSKI